MRVCVGGVYVCTRFGLFRFHSFLVFSSCAGDAKNVIEFVFVVCLFRLFPFRDFCLFFLLLFSVLFTVCVCSRGRHNVCFLFPWPFLQIRGTYRHRQSVQRVRCAGRPPCASLPVVLHLPSFYTSTMLACCCCCAVVVDVAADIPVPFTGGD